MSDNETTIDELKHKIKRFCEIREWDQYHNPKDVAIGIITEASELLEHFRFKNEQEARKLFEDPKKREEIEDEVADVLYMLIRFCQTNNIDVSDAFERKMKKNEVKYPAEKVKGLNKKYTEYA